MVSLFCYLFFTPSINKAPFLIPSGINKFVKDILSPAVQDVVKDGCIEQTRQVCKAYVSTYVPDQFRVMKDAACDLPTRKKGNKTWKPPGTIGLLF